MLSMLLFAGCAGSSALERTVSETRVQLGERPFEIVATGIEATASAIYAFGFSDGQATAALWHVEGERSLYAAAMKDLRAQAHALAPDAEPDEVELVNVRADASATNLFFVTRPIVTLRADVVVFHESTPKPEVAAR